MDRKSVIVLVVCGVLFMLWAQLTPRLYPPQLVTRTNILAGATNAVSGGTNVPVSLESAATRPFTSPFHGENIGFLDAGALFDERGQALGEQAAIQATGNFDRPVLMKVVKQPRRDAGPVVNRHSENLRFHYTEPSSNRIQNRRIRLIAAATSRD